MATQSNPQYGTRPVAELANEVRDLFEGYNAAFNARDAEAIGRKFVGLPYFELAQDGSIVVRATLDELRAQYEEAFALFEGTGWSHTEFFDVEVVPLSDNVAVLAATCDRYHTDGSVIVAGKKVTYLFRRADGAWRIAGYSYVADGFPNVMSNVSSTTRS